MLKQNKITHLGELGSLLEECSATPLPHTNIHTEEKNSPLSDFCLLCLF